MYLNTIIKHILCKLKIAYTSLFLLCANIIIVHMDLDSATKGLCCIPMCHKMNICISTSEAYRTKDAHQPPTIGDLVQIALFEH